MKTPFEALDLLIPALDRAGYDYVVGGALALGFWTGPRATLDVDITIDVAIHQLPELLVMLKGIGCTVDSERAMRAAERGDFGTVLDGVRIDVFLAGSDLVVEALQRKVTVPIGGGRELSIMTAEDVLLLKLIFGRSKDFADIERLLATQHDSLDWNYVDRWLPQLFDAGDPRLTRLQILRTA